jgi:hypothetical protein
MRFKGEELEGMEELQDKVKDLFSLVTPETGRQVCEHWIEKLNQVIHASGDHVQSQSA